MEQQPKDTAAPAAEPVKDETRAPAPVAATETKTTAAATTATEGPVEKTQSSAPKVEDDESDWEELDGELRGCDFVRRLLDLRGARGGRCVLACVTATWLIFLLRAWVQIRMK